MSDSSVERVCGGKTLGSMTKKQKYLESAEKFYVEEQLTLREIVHKLPVSYATLRSWKQKGDWDEKKKELLLSAEAFHKELYELGRELSFKIRQDMREGKDVSPARYYALGRIMDTVNKTHKYEQKILEVEEKKKRQGGKASLKDLVEALSEKLFDNKES